MSKFEDLTSKIAEKSPSRPKGKGKRKKKEKIKINSHIAKANKRKE